MDPIHGVVQLEEERSMYRSVVLKVDTHYSKA
nr:MAG TPA: hypothetical protein [Myoviridae sp. ctfuG5]